MHTAHSLKTEAIRYVGIKTFVSLDVNLGRLRNLGQNNATPVHRQALAPNCKDSLPFFF